MEPEKFEIKQPNPAENIGSKEEGPSHDNKMKTMSECISSVEKQGFVEALKVNDDDELVCLRTEKTYKPEQVHILNFYRFEGHSNPDDNAILYAIETDDGVRGTLIDAYGMYSDPNTYEFIKKVQDINKKTDPEHKL